MFEGILEPLLEFILIILEVIADGIMELLFPGKKVKTKKMNRNIEQLQKYSWFKVIYTDDKYYPLFLRNQKIRRFLQSKRRVKRLIRSRTAREKWLKLLDKQLQN